MGKPLRVKRKSLFEPLREWLWKHKTAKPIFGSEKPKILRKIVTPALLLGTAATLFYFFGKDITDRVYTHKEVKDTNYTTEQITLSEEYEPELVSINDARFAEQIFKEMKTYNTNTKTDIEEVTKTIDAMTQDFYEILNISGFTRIKTISDTDKLFQSIDTTIKKWGFEYTYQRNLDLVDVFKTKKMNRSCFAFITFLFCRELKINAEIVLINSEYFVKIIDSKKQSAIIESHAGVISTNKIPEINMKKLSLDELFFDSVVMEVQKLRGKEYVDVLNELYKKNKQDKRPNIRLWKLLGREYERNGKYKDALYLYNQVNKVFPDDLETKYLLSRVSSKIHIDDSELYKIAETRKIYLKQLYDSAVRFNPNDEKIHFAFDRAIEIIDADEANSQNKEFIQLVFYISNIVNSTEYSNKMGTNRRELRKMIGLYLKEILTPDALSMSQICYQNFLIIYDKFRIHSDEFPEFISFMKDADKLKDVVSWYYKENPQKLHEFLGQINDQALGHFLTGYYYELSGAKEVTVLEYYYSAMQLSESNYDKQIIKKMLNRYNN